MDPNQYKIYYIFVFSSSVKSKKVGKSQKIMAISFFMKGESTSPITKNTIIELIKNITKDPFKFLKAVLKNQSKIKTKPNKPINPVFTHIVRN